MVKLIRLKADESGGTEIRNTFKEPVIIEPNSKVALAGLDLKLASTGANESFTIASTDTFTLDTGYTVSPTAGEYTQQELISEIRRAMALAHHQPISGSVYVDTEFTNNRFNFFKDVAPYADALLATDFGIINGAPFVTDNGGFTGTGVEICTVLSEYPIGNSTFRATGVFGTTDQVDIVQVEESGNSLQGVGIDTLGDYTSTYKTAVTSTGVAAVATDTFDMERYGTTLRWTIKDAVGAIKYTRTETITAAEWDTYFLGEGVRFKIQCDATSIQDLTQVKCATQGTTAATSLKVEFATQILSDYLGFKGVGPYEDNDDPATIQAESDMVGDEKYPGVLITISPTMLDTYDGYKKSKFPESILYVLHSTQTLGRQVAFDVPDRIKLNLKNKGTVNLNQLRVQFRDPEGGYLRYVGRPTVTLVIYGPDEV